MPARVDYLEQKETMGVPTLISIAVHGGLFTMIALYGSIVSRGSVQWGDPHAIIGGGAVGVTSVSQIPMPTRSGLANPLANDTQSRIPSPPKPEVKKVPVPDPDAIAIKGRDANKKQPTYMRSQQYEKFRAQQDRPNQIYSSTGQALASNMLGGNQGSGGVGVGPGTAFGNRFGWYRSLLEQRVSQRWRTEDVDPRLQTAPPVIITFVIQKNGSVTDIRMMQGSGNRNLDYSAQRAISEAAPFPPLPQGYERDSAQIEFWFQLKR